MLDKRTVSYTPNRSPERFFEHRLGNVLVVYDAISGDTHWIDELSTQILDEIRTTEATTFSDLLQLLNEIDTDVPDELPSLLATSLDSLIKIDLIEAKHC